MQAALGTSYAHPAERVLRPSEQELLDAWRELVEANAAQIARLRESEAPDDFWGAGYAGSSVSLEHPAPQCRFLAALARPDDTWLDIGAGYGASMLPVASAVTHVTALDPSPGMVAKLKGNISLLGIENVEVLEPLAWPPPDPLEPHDVCLAAAVIYDVADIGGFLDAMESHAQRLCLALVAELGTGFTPTADLFEALYGEPYIRPPALREFLAVLGARRLTQGRPLACTAARAFQHQRRPRPATATPRQLRRTHQLGTVGRIAVVGRTAPAQTATRFRSGYSNAPCVEEVSAVE